MLAVLLIVHEAFEDRQIRFPSFYEIWGEIFKENNLPHRKQKICEIITNTQLSVTKKIKKQKSTFLKIKKKRKTNLLVTKKIAKKEKKEKL